LLSHFASVRKNGKCTKSIEHLEYYKNSIERFKDYLAQNSERKEKPLKELKWPCQIEKNERFWSAIALMTIFHSPNRVKELFRVFRIAFGDSPPVDISSLQDCLKGELCLFFEPNLRLSDNGVEKFSQSGNPNRKQACESHRHRNKISLIQLRMVDEKGRLRSLHNHNPRKTPKNTYKTRRKDTYSLFFRYLNGKSYDITST
jgi:hypothetical protein